LVGPTGSRDSSCAERGSARASSTRPPTGLSIIPSEGVYVTLSLVAGVWHRSVTNVGKRPTVSNDGISKIEAHLLDFDRDIYDQNVRLRFLHRLRGERKFSGLEELKAQISRDRDRAISYFEREPIRRNLGFV
jgi:riboflavin kinase/FMN adenylyltransferase